jgi:hypothetical protein
MLVDKLVEWFSHVHQTTALKCCQSFRIPDARGLGRGL